jgi:limonene-1,2-epoxide hydrolase
MRVAIRGIAELANIVTTEPIDRFHDAAGVIISSVSIMDIYEVTKDRISVWRDLRSG